jgi:hypothetical protein
MAALTRRRYLEPPKLSSGLGIPIARPIITGVESVMFPFLNIQGVCLDICCGVLVGFSMRVFQQHLSVITDTKTNLYTQLRELERLRDQVKRAQLLARRSRPKSHGKAATCRIAANFAAVERRRLSALSRDVAGWEMRPMPGTVIDAESDAILGAAFPHEY